MNRTLLAPAAVVALALVAGTRADARPKPTEGVVVDDSCFGGDDLEAYRYGSKPQRRGPPPPPKAYAPATSMSAGSAVGASAPAEASRDAAFNSAPRQRAAEESAAAPANLQRIAPGAPVPTPLDDVAPIASPKRPGSDDASLDWGGTTWLSNDDSMSLASAQRLLWALDRGARWTVGQVRPHELLNYFSFDTVKPTGDGTFEVTASAEQHDDTLAVAFAVQGATPERQPLDLTVLVDRSCSMQAEGRMDYTKRGLTTMTEQLADGDRIDVVLFDSAVCTPLKNFVVGRDDPALLQSTIDRMRPQGGTDMNAGLTEAYAVATAKQDTHRRNRRVMAITDALLNQGTVDPHVVSQVGARLEQDGIRFTGVGVGTDFNDDVLDRLTEKGKGAYVYLGSEAVVDRVFGAGFDALVQTIAHDVRFRLELPPSLALERFYGEEASTNKEDVQPINYFAGTSQVFLQDLKVHPDGFRGADTLRFVAEWRDATTGEPRREGFRVRVDQMLAADPTNVRKARALMAFGDVLLERPMGGDMCGAPLQTWRARAGLVEGDAELAYVDGLLTKQCPDAPTTAAHPMTREPVALKVKVDSDIAISAVDASCAEGSRALSGANSVARFEATPGTCRLTLHGQVPMTATVDVPRTGSDVRCLVRGGRVRCS